MRKGLPIALAGVLLLLLAACAGSSSSGAGSSSSGLHYTSALRSLNASGASGTADLTLDGNRLLIHIKVSGMVPGQSHPQHIHGDPTKTASCPPATAVDKNGLITLASGTPFYGPLALGLDAPVANATGAIDYTHSFTLSADDKDKLTHLTSHVIVVHGVMVNGEYDGTVPAACGTIVEGR